MLSILDPKMLMAARLVCRAIRAASIPCITALRYHFRNAEDPSSASDLTCRLQVFTSVGSLDLGINLFPVPHFFEAPGVLSVLRRLRLSWPEMEICADQLRHLATTVAAATQLTALEVSGELCEVPGFGILLAGSLGACTALRDLKLDVCDSRKHVDVWEGLLGKSAQLSRLEALGTVVLYSKADFEAVAALTQLTRLSLDVRSRETLHLTLLSSLTALQSLHVAWHVANWRGAHPPSWITCTSWSSACRSCGSWILMKVWDGDLERTAFPCCISPRHHELQEQFCCPDGGTVPDSFCPVGLSKLRKLSIPLQFNS
jgi:hypothetical protein